jgi:hypothetical protein
MSELTSTEIQKWQKFYREQFGLEVDFTDIAIPPKPSNGSWRLLIIAAGMTSEKVFAQCAKLFSCWKYYSGDLNVTFSYNARTAEKHYAVWVRDGVEPDVDLLGLSVSKADPHMKIGITLPERLMQELKYFVETGEHLDKRGSTFCSGSRDADGGVPYVCHHPDNGKVYVHWCDVDCSHVKCGVRQVVAS